MKRLLAYLFIVLGLGLTFSVNAYSANEGSGPIDFPPKFEKRFKAYLSHVANEKSYSFVFAFHPNGANDFQAIRGKNKKKKFKSCRKTSY